MNVSKTITIDLNRPKKNVVHLGQDDNVREVLVTLLCDGVPYDITADAPSGSFVFTVKYIKANSVPGEYATTSTGLDAVTKVNNTTNQYIVRLDEHATDVPGFAEAFLTIYETTGTPQVLHSFPITIDVVRTTTDGTDPSAPYYNGTPYLVKAKQFTKTAAMTQPVGMDSDGKLWTTPGGGGGGSNLLVVSLNSSGVPDTSSSDIYSAWQAGYVIKLRSSIGIEYDLQHCTATAATFTTTINGSNAVIVDGYVIEGLTATHQVLNGYVKPSGGIPESDLASAVRNKLPLQVTISWDGSDFISDKTFSQVSTAVTAGQPIDVAIDDMYGWFGYITNSTATFYAIDKNSGGTPILYTFELTSSGVSGTTKTLGDEIAPTKTTVSGSTPSITAADNTIYVCGELTSLEITDRGQNISFTVDFTSGSTATVLTVPSGYKAPGGDLTPEADKTYELNVRNGKAVLTPFEAVSSGA